MTFEEFYRRFGGSFRTKHLCVLPSSFAGAVRWGVDLLFKSRARRKLGKRFCALPRESALPREFIRLEPWEAEYLFLLAGRARRGILEVGRLHGGSTFLLACANPDVPVYSIDLAPRGDARLQEYCDRHGVGRNLRLIVGDSQRGSYPQIGAIDLLFIDGDHSYQGCTNDLENHYPRVAPGGHVVLHDCYHGSEVQSSVIDFIGRHLVQVLRSPYVLRSHWQTAYGSLVHFQKPVAHAA